ncbi:SRPBCC domain-containing protein [Streptomyces sp. NPDC046876]|uniref:CoxG family protein n=1 Tax=Streptomyces sp. NPDC046876 TaxID=3155616 RepID=UPI0033E039B9
MEHQVFVPVQADSLRAVLRDPARVARCVPGLQQDAGTDAGTDAGSGSVAGRLKLRVGGNTVTYRGGLSVTEQDPDHFAVAGEGTEIRGSGTVTLTVALRLTPTEGGTTLDLTAHGTAGGRTAGLAPEAVEGAVQRLLERAAGLLAAQAAGRTEAEAGDPGDTEEAGDAGDGGPARASVFDTEVPPPSLEPSRDPGQDPSGEPALDPFLDGDFGDISDFTDLGDLDRLREIEAYTSGAAQPPAEAAHARRTMIGRSAEEVDHAPPRGRYAPVPAPATTTGGAGLRWIAPAAAFALASAVVLGRALRRRR